MEPGKHMYAVPYANVGVTWKKLDDEDEDEKRQLLDLTGER